MSSVEINQFNLSSGLLNKHKKVLFSNEHWHKIVVENVEGLKRNIVLKTIMKACYPLHFIPVCFDTPSNNTATFLLKNCGSAIEKICALNLILENPETNSKPFKMSIHVCFAAASGLKINIQSNVVNVLNKRFNRDTGVLNLEKFDDDPDLEEYIPLVQPKLFFYILHLARSLAFKSLKLNYNDIEYLKPMDALSGVKTLTSVDLSHNNIKQISEIKNMQSLNITELWLDGNPICDNHDELSYSKAIREIFDKIEKLDGANIKLKGFLPFRRNFLCCQTGYDLVDQFLEHYFTLYDTHNRSVLDGMYHKEALLSLTSLYLPLQSTSATAKLNDYKRVSRNLKQISDFSKNSEFLFVGPRQIINVLRTLPLSEHDPFSFTVDLVQYTEKMATLVVGGVFREVIKRIQETERIFGFTRTFVLLAGENGQFSIINEMIHVTNASTLQAAKAFKYMRIPKPRFIQIPQPQNPKEMLDVEDAFKIVTGLNTDWAQKCLEECNYDLKKSLVLFVDLLKLDKVPNSAFTMSRDTEKHDIKESEIDKSSFTNILNQPHQYGTSAQRSNQPLASQMGNTQQINQSIPPHPVAGNMHATNIKRPAVQPTQHVNTQRLVAMAQINKTRPIVPPMQQMNTSVAHRQHVNTPRPVVTPMRQMNVLNVAPVLRINTPRPAVLPIQQVNTPRAVVTPVRPVNPPRPMPAMPPRINLHLINPRPIMPPFTRSVQINHPIMGNIQAVVPTQPSIPPLGNMQQFSAVQHPQVSPNQIFKNTKQQKNTSRVGLVNIQLRK